MSEKYFIGFDPGGANAFGWAVLLEYNANLEVIQSSIASTATEAFSQASAACPTPPLAVGIDAPLFWSPSGDRNADRKVRRMVCDQGGSSGTVSHVNSLRGACLVQGVLIGKMINKAWPEAQITEAHPKALLAISSTSRRFIKRLQLTPSEHERDAALAAFSARQFADKSIGWLNLALNEKDDIFHPVTPKVAYWFPASPN